MKTLVVYSKGNMKTQKDITQGEGVTYFNTSRMPMSTLQGMRFNRLIVSGVVDEDKLEFIKSNLIVEDSNENYCGTITLSVK